MVKTTFPNLLYFRLPRVSKERKPCAYFNFNDASGAVAASGAS